MRWRRTWSSNHSRTNITRIWGKGVVIRENPKDIWILAEVEGEELREVVLELASEGRRLADKLGEKLCAVLLGGDPKEFGEYLSQFGVDTIHHAKTGNGIDAFIQLFSHLMCKYNPRLLLVGSTPMGSEFAPRIAARNEIRITTDCVILNLNDSGYFEVTKMVFGDKIYSTIETPVSETQIVTVVPGSFDLAVPGLKRETEVVIENVEMGQIFSGIKYVEFVKGDPQKIDISEAEIIVAAGRGVGGMEGLKKIERLAEVLEGTVGGSRVAVDQGWIPFEKQIGQTGQTVSPKLFVSCGISGAFEFTTGMKDSRLIVAINNDPKAPIFRVSNLSLVGDLHTVVPEIVEQLEKLLREEIK
jgi:electron transfer flavoprotein alpha subunit